MARCLIEHDGRCCLPEQQPDGSWSVVTARYRNPVGVHRKHGSSLGLTESQAVALSKVWEEDLRKLISDEKPAKKRRTR